MQNNKKTKVIKKDGHVITISNYSDKSDLFCRLLVELTLGTLGGENYEETTSNILHDEREKAS